MIDQVASKAREMWRDRRGGIAQVFAFSLIPLLGIVGAAVDYGYATNFRAKLQNSADSAALHVATQISSSADASPTANKYQSIAAAALQSNMANRVLASVEELRICTAAGGDCTTSAGATLNAGDVYVRATANSPRYITQLYPLTYMGSRTTIPIGVASTVNSGAGGSAPYIDIYLLVDVSASMGLGASPSDQQGMTDSMGCAFACHNDDPNQKSTTSNDTVLLAHNLGYQLRIDAVKSALKNVVATAKAAVDGGQANIRFGIHTFANPFKTVLPLSGNFGAATDLSATSIYGAVNSLDIAQFNAGTDTPNALKQMAAIAQKSGDGKTQATAKTFVFVATDGAADTLDNPPTGGSYVVWQDWLNWNPTSASAAQWTDFVANTNQYSTNGQAIKNGLACTNYQALANTIYSTNTAQLQALFGNLPTCVAQPYWSGYYGTQAGKALSSQFEELLVMPINPAWCDKLKATGSNIMTLYVTYDSPAPPQQPYVNYVTFAVVPKIEAGMKACASKPDYAFKASDTASINAAMKKMFDGAVGGGGVAGSIRIVR